MILALLMLMWHMLRRMFRRVEVFFEVYDNADPDMFLEERNARLVSTPTSLCPWIHLDRTVVAEDVWLLAANREDEIHPSHVVPEIDGGLFRLIGLDRKSVV